MNPWVVGIDLGATKIALGLINPLNEIVATRRLATEAHLGPQSAVNRIAQAVGEMAREAGASPVAVGVCSPGPVDHQSGMIVDPPNLRGWLDVPFRQMLSEPLGLPVSLEHDAKAAALGEFHFGAGREMNACDLVYVIVGTGVGAAIILDGQVYRGRHNSAGEVGHITINRTGEPGSSGVPGCVESYTSGPSLAAHYARRMGRNIDSENLARLAVQGDADALAVFADAGDALAAGIATMAMLMDVDLYVIGGSVAKTGDLIIEPARRALPKYAFQSVAARVQIVATKLHEAGAILGCAWQARQLI
jgi:glucokinase